VEPFAPDSKDTSHSPLLGVVQQYNATKGYGFIRTDSGASVYVHSSSINRPGFQALREGERVAFEISNVRGLQAVNVHPT
jgi:CspA family cold shock protein